MINYKTFKINSDNLNTLAPIFLQQLERLDDNHFVTIVTYDLSGNKKTQKVQVKQAKETFKNPKMNDLLISSTKMEMNPCIEYDEITEQLTGFEIK